MRRKRRTRGPLKRPIELTVSLSRQQLERRSSELLEDALNGAWGDDALFDLIGTIVTKQARDILEHDEATRLYIREAVARALRQHAKQSVAEMAPDQLERIAALLQPKAKRKKRA